MQNEVEESINYRALIAQLRSELDRQEARYKELGNLIPKLQDERRELRYSNYGGGGGKIVNTEHELRRAEVEFETSRLPLVRVVEHSFSGNKEWRFVKMTAKRIYLRGQRGDEFWELDGSSRYNGTIDADDLRKILAGEIARPKM